jgi:hypothetical protein
MKAAAGGAGYATATDLADWLVRELKCRSARPTTSPARPTAPGNVRAQAKAWARRLTKETKRP